MSCAVNDANLIPSGDVKIGPYDYNIFTNSQIDNIDDNGIPLKTMRSFGRHGRRYRGPNTPLPSEQYRFRSTGNPLSTCRCWKREAIPIPFAIVDGVKDAVANLTNVPKSLVTKVVFDQSIFVKNAIQNLMHEGAIGLVLTGLMILIFSAVFGLHLAYSCPISAIGSGNVHLCWRLAAIQSTA